MRLFIAINFDDNIRDALAENGIPLPDDFALLSPPRGAVRAIARIGEGRAAKKTP